MCHILSILILFSVFNSNHAWCIRVNKNDTYHHLLGCFKSSDYKADLMKAPAEDTMDIWFAISRIPTVENNSFARFPRLRLLVLMGCNIGTIQEHAFQGIPEVKIIMIPGNGLETLKGVWFANNLKLHKLVIPDNLISSIDNEFINVVSKMRDFEYLDLSGNLLTTLNPNDVGVLKRIQTLNLDGNPWNYKTELLIGDRKGNQPAYRDLNEIRDYIYMTARSCKTMLPNDVSDESFEKCVDNKLNKEIENLKIT